MEMSQFIQIGLPISLALIMLSLGLTIHLSDFVQQLSLPRPLLAGLFAQLLLVPLLALIIVAVFDLPPTLAAGLMILSFCPGGVTSNWFSHMARGNVPLSISLTVIASLITPFTIPALSEFSLQVLMDDSRAVHIPPGLTMARLFIVSVLPVIIGIAIHERFAAISGRWQPLVYKLATGLFLSVIAAILLQQWTHLPELVAQSGIASLSMIVAGMSLGAFLAHSVKLNRSDRNTIAIEVGMQNGGMALIVTQNVLHSPELSIVPVIYGLIMLIPVYLFSRYARTQPV